MNAARLSALGAAWNRPRSPTQASGLVDLGVFVVPFDTNRVGIESMRFGPHCAVPELMRLVPIVTKS
jgi:hypothetical protein